MVQQIIVERKNDNRTAQNGWQIPGPIDEMGIWSSAGEGEAE